MFNFIPGVLKIKIALGQKKENWKNQMIFLAHPKGNFLAPLTIVLPLTATEAGKETAICPFFGFP